jgi:hypothetical protein
MLAKSLPARRTEDADMDYATIMGFRAMARALVKAEHVSPDFYNHFVACLDDALVKADADQKRGAYTLLEELRARIAQDAKGG